MSTVEAVERKYPVLPNEIGKPLSEKEMYELLEARKENLVTYEWFLGFSEVRKVFESIRSENRLVGAEILESIEQPDASEIKLQLRWPVKSDVLEGRRIFGRETRKVKSYPSAYNYVTVNFDRVQPKWSPDYGSEPYWTASIEGEETEGILSAGGSLSPNSVEVCVKKAFSNPKTIDFESPSENQ